MLQALTSPKGREKQSSLVGSGDPSPAESLMQLVCTGGCYSEVFLPIQCSEWTGASGDAWLALLSRRGQVVLRIRLYCGLT